jgi:hypothetical protein
MDRPCCCALLKFCSLHTCTTAIDSLTPCLQVYEHDSVTLPGNGVVTHIKSVDNRVFVLELFGSVTLLDAVWTPGCRHAALIPVATHRDQAWVQAFVPLDRCTIAAAVHAHVVCLLRLDEARNRCRPADQPQGVHVPMN